MWVFIVCGLLVCGVLNILLAGIGFRNIHTGEKDILLPFSAMVFLFYPLLIYLPEAHHKIVTFGNRNASRVELKQEEEDFPWAFMITLISVTFATILHRMCLFNIDTTEESKELSVSRREDRSLTRSRIKQVEKRAETKILKYYLSLALGLQNIVSSYYLTIEQDEKVVKNEFLIYGVFSLLINFAFGYINGWSAVDSQFHFKLTCLINVPILIGSLIGLACDGCVYSVFILVLPCVCGGLMMYSCALVCLPLIFSNGEHQTQDKFRYGSIFTSLLLTVVYHPFCYLLRV